MSVNNFDSNFMEKRANLATNSDTLLKWISDVGFSYLIGKHHKGVLPVTLSYAG